MAELNDALARLEALEERRSAELEVPGRAGSLLHENPPAWYLPAWVGGTVVHNADTLNAEAAPGAPVPL